MGKALAFVCLIVAACQPMYERKPDPLRNPSRVPPPKAGTVATGEPEPTFVDTCNVNFTAPPTTRRKEKASANETVAGNAALQSAGPPPTRATTSQAVQSVTSAIDHYRSALLADPYNAEATLQLALAYDRVLRKGCALAMLRRLDALAANPAFEPAADPFRQQVAQNPHWFRPYHDEALRALGL